MITVFKIGFNGSENIACKGYDARDKSIPTLWAITLELPAATLATLFAKIEPRLVSTPATARLYDEYR